MSTNLIQQGSSSFPPSISKPPFFYQEEMSKQISIYVESDKDRNFFLTATEKQQSVIDFEVYPLTMLPKQSQDVLTIVVTDNQNILGRINADKFHLLVVIVRDKLSIPKNNQLSNAIVYLNTKDELYPVHLKDVLLRMIPDSMAEQTINLDALDFKQALSFNQFRYLKFTHELDDKKSLDEMDFDGIENDTSFIFCIKSNQNTTLKRTREIIKNICKRVIVCDNEDYTGDLFYDVFACEDNVEESFYVLYTVS
jgi:hypothetical protein